MDNYSGNKEYNIYRDIRNRTNGEIYLGVVGPVRTGKSTFIKRFMELMVLPFMEGEAEKERAMDELPQAAAGKTIMTTEPKFIPQQAAEIRLSDFKTEEEPLKLRVRLIDCVGFLADGAVGHMEGNGSRMVKTPWSDQEIPFAEAASIGTEKVIRDHATIGIVVTTDGTIGELAAGKLHKCRRENRSGTEKYRKAICDPVKFGKTLCAGDDKTGVGDGGKLSDNGCAGQL